MYIALSISFVFSAVSRFTECSLPICTHRLENTKLIIQANPKLKNCSYVIERYPICGEAITVVYAEQPPYVVPPKERNGKPIGLLPDMLNETLHVCCFGCKNVTYRGPVDHTERFNSMTADIFMPVQSSSSSSYFDDKDFISMVDASKVSVLAKQRTLAVKSSDLTLHMLESVISTWPLFLIAILMAISSGCVVWTLDTWYNEEHFPQRFPKGIFEGFWWGFISMTTVGYGDRVPSSTTARLFSVLWIFLGITMFNMYTAVLTTALSVKTHIFDIKDFTAVDVGALSSTSLGKTVIYLEHGNVHLYSSVEEAARDLDEDKIKGIALDANVARYHMAELKTIVSLIRQHHMVSGIDHSYGMLSRHRNLTIFIKEFLKTNSDHRSSLISFLLYKRWPHMKHIENEVPQGTFFNYHSPMFSYTVVSLIVISIFVTMIGLIYRRLFVFKKRRRNTISVKTLEISP